MNLDDLDPVTYEVIIELFKTLAMKSTSMCKYLSGGLYFGDSGDDRGSYIKLYNEITDVRSSIEDVCSKYGLKYNDLWFELMVKRDIMHR